MKFLIITNHSYMLWQFRRELIEALLQRGEVVIGTPFVGHEKDFEELGCRCVETKLERRGKNLLQEAALFERYRKLLQREKPDLVITYSIKPNIYAGLLCQRMKIPYCCNVQGLGTAFQSQKSAAAASVLYRAGLKKAKTVFFENTGNASVFVEKRIIPESKITVLSGAGINLERFPVQPYPLEEQGIHFLYLGRIMREKGMDEWFSAAQRIKAEYGNKAQFDMVGFFEDDYKHVVEELVQKSVIHFYGFQEDPKPYYAAAHCAVLPSWHEGMSNVLLEAAATGRAVITNDIPGCREAVEEGKTGFLTRAKDAESLYQAMVAFLTLSPEDREQMGQLGRKKIESEFDKKRVVKETLDALGV